MGGMFSSGGASVPNTQQPQNISDAQMMQFLQSMQNQEQATIAAQQRAQQQALTAAQQAAAQQTMSQYSQQAQQKQEIGNQMQQIKDQEALNAEQQRDQAAGAAATGGPVDINAIKSAAISNLGAAAGTLPSTQANVAYPGIAPINPAMTSAGTAGSASSIFNAANKFNAPNMQGIKFGGG